MVVKPFIVCNKDQEKLCELSNQLTKLTNNIAASGDKDRTINEQFLQAINLTDNEDFLLLVKSDIEFFEWSALLKDSIVDFKKHHWGAYTLNIGSFYDGVDIEKISDHLTRVSSFDISLCFIHKEIIDALKKINLNWMVNKQGIGISSIICSLCTARRRLVIKNNAYSADYQPRQIVSINAYRKDYFNLCSQLPDFLRKITVNNEVWASV